MSSQSLSLLLGESFGQAFADTKNSELHTILNEASVSPELCSQCRFNNKGSSPEC